MSERKKIAIVTGASSGMGRAFVQQIMDKYRRIDEIWVIARHLQKEMWKERFGTKIVPLSLDLLQEQSQEQLRRRLFAEDVRVKILVNAAGMGRIGTFEEITLPEHQQTTRLNDEALMTVTYLCLPYMRKDSRVVQMASASAFVPQPGFAVYAASKAYVMSFSRALRSEVRKKGITVVVCLGILIICIIFVNCRCTCNHCCCSDHNSCHCQNKHQSQYSTLFHLLFLLLKINCTKKYNYNLSAFFRILSV